MSDHSTIWLALDLLQSPSGVKRLRASPLPADVGVLLAIAAGDGKTIERAAEITSWSPNRIREAAAFYIEQIMLHPDADHYRVLGVNPNASTPELRRNMAWLIRWLHPDRTDGGERSAFANRVTKAWNDLKTEDRRASYDLSRRRASAQRSEVKPKQPKKQPSSPFRPSHTASTLSCQQRPSPGAHHPGILMRVLMLFGKTLN